MDEIERLRLYREQLAAQVRNTELPDHDRNAAAAVLAAGGHLTGARLRPRDELRTSGPGRSPTRTSDTRRASRSSTARSGTTTTATATSFEHWTRDVRDHDTVICLGDAAMGRPTDGLIDRIRRRPGRKILVVGNHDHAHIRRLGRAPLDAPAEAVPRKPRRRQSPRQPSRTAWTGGELGNVPAENWTTKLST